jgi:hypothetical protein
MVVTETSSAVAVPDVSLEEAMKAPQFYLLGKITIIDTIIDTIIHHILNMHTNNAYMIHTSRHYLLLPCYGGYGHVQRGEAHDERGKIYTYSIQ